MRKIKSVKLAKEFNNGEAYAKIGTELNISSNIGSNHCCLILSTGVKWCFALKTVIENMTGLFAIEYEPEGFELKRYTEYGFIDYDGLMERELNRLADWCDGQCEDNRNHKYSVAMQGNKFAYYSHSTYSHQGLKFCSEKSAELFITELNKPENSDYKNYFINLLKKTRL